MSSTWTAPTRRSLLATSAIGGAALLASPGFADVAVGAGASQIRPFHAHFADDALLDLRRRVAATRWPSRA